MSLLDLFMGKKQSVEDIDNDNQRYGRRYTSDAKILSLRKLRNKQLDEMEKVRLQKAILQYNIQRQRGMMSGNTGMIKKDAPQVRQQRWFDKRKV